MDTNGILIVSPHLDDAALSLGGMMLHKPRTRVLNLFNTAWSEDGELNKQSAEAITRSNLNEEKRVMRRLRATFSYEALPEALVRDPLMKWCDPINLERDHKTQIRAAFAIAHAGLQEKEIFFPLAVGEHVDHVLVHNLIVPFMMQTMSSGASIKLYEDLPYSTYNDDENNYKRRMSRVGREFNLTPELIDITSVLDKKISILSLYKSQLNHEHLERVRTYALGLGDEVGQPGKAFERVWTLNNAFK